jgi:PAS domain S-box-containing protein
VPADLVGMSVGFLDRPSSLLTEAFERSAVAKAVVGLSDGLPIDLVEANAAFCALAGRTRETLIGRRWTEHFVALVPPAVTEGRLVRPDGTAVWVSISAVPVRDGEYVLFEIVEAGGEARFRALFDSSPLCVAIADDTGRMLRVNDAFEAMLGRGRDELIGHSFAEYTHPGDRTDGELELRRVSAEPGAVSTFEKRYLRPDGSIIWARVGLTAVPGPAGESHAMVQCEDVTVRKSAEAANAALLAERTAALAALEASETRFRLAFESSPLGLTLISLSAPDYGRYLQCNPAMTAISGYSAEELSEMTFHDLVYPDDVPSEELLRRALAKEPQVPLRTVVRYRHKDGHTVWVVLRTGAVRDEHGTALYLVNQVEDVTAQREAESQLRRQARLLELIPAAVIVREPGGTIRWWNAGASQLYGWPLEAVTGKVSQRLLNTVFPGRETERDQLAALQQDGHWAGQLDHLTADGKVVTVLSRQVLHRPRHGPDQILEINTDVTAARAAERALSESEQRFRAQFTYSATGQVVHALDGTLSAVNPAYAAMVGSTAEELTGTDFRTLLHPDDAAVAAREIAGLFAGEANAFTRDGRLRHTDGHWVDVSATISVVRDAAGRVRHLIGMVTDISDRRAAERARDQAGAVLAERNAQLEAANQLKLDIIGMLGHEIGNPLSSIRGYTEVLAEDWVTLSDDHRQRAVDAINRQSLRLDEIVHEVLAMVTIEAGTIDAVRTQVSLREVIGGALATADQERLPVRGADARVLCNPGHIQQILVNLLSNAAKYGGGATGLTISGDGTRVRVRVEDRGPGVPEEFRHRLFQKLARAERDATNVRGTGLGLYIVRGLAQANHGDISHEPNPGGGSVFVLDLERVPA